MRIAQVAPLYESVPPRFYGGTERVVSYLTEELVRQGHEVTLFASGDSITEARLVSVWDTALRLDPREPEPISLHTLMVEEVFKRLASFDIVHFHTDSIHLPLTRRYSTPCVTTLHGRLDLAGLSALYREYAEQPVVSISNSQRLPLQHANWVGTVHHGLPLQLYSPGSGKGGYLTFLGRISPEKRADRAIEIARLSGIPLKIAAKVDRADRDYFETCIRPLIDGRHIEYLGELSDRAKGALLGESTALVFPIDWPEPFGLAMIEALACGTPVIAFRCGAVPEIIEDGFTGCVVDSIEEAVERLEALHRISRAHCRKEFEQRFCAERMAKDYCEVYARMLRHADKSNLPRYPADPVRHASGAVQ